MLAAWNAGDAHTLDRLMDLVYPKVRRIARQQLVRRTTAIWLPTGAFRFECAARRSLGESGPTRRRRNRIPPREAGRCPSWARCQKSARIPC